MRQKDKKAIGWVILLIAIFFLDPLPSFTDSLTLPIYSAYSGEHITMNNLASVYFDYTIWCLVIGGFLLLIAMHLLGWNWKKLLQKLNIGKYKIALGIGVLVVMIIAYLDVQGLIFFTDLGRDYTSGDFPHSYWIAFRNTAYILMGLVALCYWSFVRKDKSETLAVFLTPFILFWFGLADILYFVYQKLPIPDTLPWLDGHFPIGWISNTLGFDGVTNVSLMISIFVGSLIVLLLTKFMKDKI